MASMPSSVNDGDQSESGPSSDPLGKVGVLLFLVAFGLMAAIVLSEILLSLVL